MTVAGVSNKESFLIGAAGGSALFIGARSFLGWSWPAAGLVASPAVAYMIYSVVRELDCRRLGKSLHPSPQLGKGRPESSKHQVKECGEQVTPLARPVLNHALPVQASSVLQTDLGNVHPNPEARSENIDAHSREELVVSAEQQPPEDASPALIAAKDESGSTIGAARTPKESDLHGEELLFAIGQKMPKGAPKLILSLAEGEIIQVILPEDSSTPSCSIDLSALKNRNPLFIAYRISNELVQAKLAKATEGFQFKNGAKLSCARNGDYVKIDYCETDFRRQLGWAMPASQFFAMSTEVLRERIEKWILGPALNKDE